MEWLKGYEISLLGIKPLYFPDANTEILEHFSAHRLSQVTKDLVHLLENATGYTATVSGLQDMYRQNFDRPFRAEDYDCENLLDVLKAIPNHVQVTLPSSFHNILSSKVRKPTRNFHNSPTKYVTYKSKNCLLTCFLQD